MTQEQRQAPPRFAPISALDQAEKALDRGAALVVSISGGKDSQAMALALAELHRQRGWTGPIVALHADLGRVEWEGDPEIAGFRSAPEQVEKIAADAGLPLYVVHRNDGQDMIDHWEARAKKLAGTGKPFWSSSSARYCTSDMKRDPMDIWTRAQGWTEVVVAEGLRAQESEARAKKARWQVRSKLKTRKRSAWTWRPIFDWDVLDVWRAMGTSWWELRQKQEAWRSGDTSALADWPGAPAYVLGNSRLSCAMCVLASPTDLVNGARHNPNTWREMRRLERQYGSKFTVKLSLEEIGRRAGLVEATQELEAAA